MPNTTRVPGVALAYEFLEGRGPVVVFCAGFGSDMAGTKAMRLAQACAARGQAMLRFDYSGHGQSGGRFVDGCIGDWAADAAHIVDVVTQGRDLLLVGSSMGGWISLLLARALGTRVNGLLLIAPAPDFTELLMKPALSDEQKEILQREGVIYPPSEYGDPLPITRKLLEDGAQHLLLNRQNSSAVPGARAAWDARCGCPLGAERAAGECLGKRGCPAGLREGWRPSAIARGGSGSASRDAGHVPRPGCRLGPRDRLDSARPGGVPPWSWRWRHGGYPPRS